MNTKKNIWEYKLSVSNLAFDAVEFVPAWLLDEKAESKIFPVSIPNGDRQVSLKQKNRMIVDKFSLLPKSNCLVLEKRSTNMNKQIILIITIVV